MRYLTKIANLVMIWDVGNSGCLRVTPQPNIGTGVRFPGEPVAVMAEYPLIGGALAARNSRKSPADHWNASGKGRGYAEENFHKPKPKDLPGGPCESHGFLA